MLYFNQVPESKVVKSVSRRWNGCSASVPPWSPITGIPTALAGQSLPTPKTTNSAFSAASSLVTATRRWLLRRRSPRSGPRACHTEWRRRGVFLLQVAPLAAPGRMLMGAADSGVDAQVPRDRTLRTARDWSRVRTRCQVPFRWHRRNRSQPRTHGPYSTGTSRHGTPVRTRNRMPSISGRRDQTGGRPPSSPAATTAPASPTALP